MAEILLAESNDRNPERGICAEVHLGMCRLQLIAHSAVCPESRRAGYGSRDPGMLYECYSGHLSQHRNECTDL